MILDFWGTWCGPCLASLPKMATLARTYRDSNVVVLTIHDASATSIEDYREKYAMGAAKQVGTGPSPFVELIDRPATLRVGDVEQEVNIPTTGRTITAYGVRMFPTMLVIDTQGRFVGKVPEEPTTKLDAEGRMILGSFDAADNDSVIVGLLRKARQQ